MELAGKTALVTGDARGIGRGIALALAAEGVNLALADLGAAQDGALTYRLAEPSDLEETVRLARAAGTDAVPLVADVTRAAGVETMVAETVRQFGRLDILVNNAGILVAGPIEQTSEAQWDRLMAVTHKLPTMFGPRAHAEAGGLLSFGPDRVDLFTRGAIYVDKILRGAKPADLPVQQPTKFEFVINLKTAKALGLTIPQSVLFRADHVIQ